jgi:hypothetical protein
MTARMPFAKTRKSGPPIWVAEEVAMSLASSAKFCRGDVLIADPFLPAVGTPPLQFAQGGLWAFAVRIDQRAHLGYGRSQ